MKSVLTGIVLSTALAIIAGFSLTASAVDFDMNGAALRSIRRLLPVPPASAYMFSAYRTAPLQVALVFGRASGCSEAAPELIEATAKAAVEAGIDPAVYAATIATESACNPLAVSSRGAVGLSQVAPHVWKNSFDFSSVNLFNPNDNLRVGANIEAGLINQYGLSDGVRHYQGTGTETPGYDGKYVDKILKLAGK